MSLVFVSFCFVKTVSASEKFLTRSTLYHLTLIQTVSIFFSANDALLTPENLLCASFLLLFSAPVFQNSFLSLDENKECFILSKRLYNRVNNHRNIKAKITVLYDNSNNRYDAIKNNLKKIVMSVIDQLKISKKNTPHIIASDIEWNYAGTDSKASNISSEGKQKSKQDFDTLLESIEKKYAAMNSPNKRQRINLMSTLRSNTSRQIAMTMNLINTIAQVKNSIFSIQELIGESTNQEVTKK
ncbi:hypothetical protein F8M41_007840 [Gigaspora margarita]|uniref:Uncharacterized protein n=1 Tax=Gigaspora margarita TaxID=4874 RepID=A0A8H4A330_GIGMA|nr:hypothetical protein F8M41_007840 [Gigaspora margarita]